MTLALGFTFPQGNYPPSFSGQNGPILPEVGWQDEVKVTAGARPLHEPLQIQGLGTGATLRLGG